MKHLLILLSLFRGPAVHQTPPPPPPPPPVVAVAQKSVVAPTPLAAPVAPDAAPVPQAPVVPPAPVVPAEPAQPPAMTADGLLPGQCAITWNAVQTDPVSGQPTTVNGIYRGDCGEAQTIAGEYPGAIVVQAPNQSVDPGCSAAGDCTSPTMGGDS